MKKKIILITTLLTSVFVMVGCSKITEGEVYDKVYKEAHTQMVMMPIVHSNGKTTYTTYNTMWFFYPDSYEIYIKKYNRDKEKYDKAIYYVEKSDYNKINIGDWFEYDENTMMEEQIKEEVEGE